MFDQIYNWVFQQITTNDIFAGIIGGSTFASALYMARSVPSNIVYLTKHQLTCELTIFNDDESYEWVDEWLSKQSYARRARRLKLSTVYHGGNNEEDEKETWNLVPGPGMHWFFYRNRPILVERSIEKADGQGKQRRETLQFRTFGRDQKFIRGLVDEANKTRVKEDRIEIYSFTNYWKRVARKLPRELETIILPLDQLRRILEDTEWFFNSENWYRERGVPYRRGYLFYGVPGTGKSTLVAGLATHFRRPIYTLNLGSLYQDSQIFDALSSVPAHAILLIEDVDAAHASIRKSMKRKKKDKDSEEDEEEFPGVSMSALLNAIDGVASTDGRLLIMTTNHIDTLDQALIRCGRVDMQEEFLSFGLSEVVRMFRRFFPHSSSKDVKYIEDNFTGTILPATLQEVLLQNRNDQKAAAKAVVTVEQKNEGNLQ